MQFIDRFTGAERERLLAAGRVVRVLRAEHLIRQGERGGDIFLVEDGTFEVVDSRSSPEVVLNVVGPGTVLGEMAFLDESPRGADVRALANATCRLWERAALLGVLEREPEFAAAFYRALASTMVDRMREVTESAVAGGFGGASHTTTHVAEALTRHAHDIAGSAQLRWIRAEAALRRNTSDEGALEETRRTFHDMRRKACEWIETFSDPSDARAAGAALSRELRPYLVRATTGELSLEPASQRAGEPRLLAHVLLGQGSGDGVFGQTVDAAILDLPTCRAMRARTASAALAVEAALPSDRPARVTLLNAATGALLARLVPTLADQGASVSCIDGSREALAFLDTGLSVRPRSVELRLACEDLASLAQGRAGVLLGEQDIIVIDGLCEYLPDRLVAALITTAARRLAPGGRLVLTSLAPAPDSPVFDHLLGWPMVRRTRRGLLNLVSGAGLAPQADAGSEVDAGAALVVTGLRPAGASLQERGQALAPAADTA